MSEDNEGHSKESERILHDALAARAREEARLRDRPHISPLRTILQIVLPLAAAAGLFAALYLPTRRLSLALVVSLCALGIYIVARTRSILLWCIRMYQRFAPSKVRMRCVFTPSCSEYAEQALRRYGVICGLPKIFARLRRCHPPNGGDDPLA